MIPAWFAAKVTLDVGKNSGGSQYTAFLKTASLNYKASDQLSLDLGMIGTKNFKFMEKAWGKRYIEKSALDKYKWANSADAGISGTFKISDMISIDAQMVNGEGYKNTQSDGLFRTGAGVTIKLNDKISGRLFIDNVPSSIDSVIYDQQTITTGAIVYKNSNSLYYLNNFFTNKFRLGNVSIFSFAFFFRFNFFNTTRRYIFFNLIVQ